MDDEIHYLLTADDIAAIPAAYGRPAYGSKNWGRHERLRRVLAGMTLGGLVFVLMKAYITRESGMDLPPWIDGLAPVGAGGFMGFLLRPRPPVVAPDDPRTGDRWLTWWREAFRIRARDYTVEIRWRAVTELRVANGWVFLTTTWGEIHMVPLRAFDGTHMPNCLTDFEAAWAAGRAS